MDPILIYTIGSDRRIQYAARFLDQFGFHQTDHPAPEVTHLLLDIPSFSKSGNLFDDDDLPEILRMLPSSVTLIGGNLDVGFLTGFRKIDLLKNPFYLAKNAAITAECTLQAVSSHMVSTFYDSPALILGWGRIGKCLSKLLSALNCPVSIAARKEQDRAILEALGFKAVDFHQVPKILSNYKLLFNTVPALSFPADWLDLWSGGIAMDLASLPGMPGSKFIPARGLPGKYAPESSGKLIAESILRLYKEGLL